MRAEMPQTTFYFLLGTDYTDFTDKVNEKTVKSV